MAFDTVDRRALLFGGYYDPTSPTNRSNDLWMYYVRGTTCSTGGDCDTPACVDGVCCEDCACGTCSACNTAGNRGVCAPVAGCTSDAGARDAMACIPDAGPDAPPSNDASIDGSSIDAPNGDAASVDALPSVTDGALPADGAGDAGDAAAADGPSDASAGPRADGPTAPGLASGGCGCQVGARSEGEGALALSWALLAAAARGERRFAVDCQ
jgi:hypothetical protein